MLNRDLKKFIASYFRFELNVTLNGLMAALISGGLLWLAWQYKYGEDSNELFRIIIPVSMWLLCGVLWGLSINASKASRDSNIQPGRKLLNGLLVSILILYIVLFYVLPKVDDGWNYIFYGPLYLVSMLLQLALGALLMIIGSLNPSIPQIYMLVGFSPWIYRALKWSYLFLMRSL